ncbi:MAG: ABC transporter permease [Chitinophagaceae bacterium]|nr:ABC transporter permease [Chitinophagaceae bacterium]
MKAEDIQSKLQQDDWDLIIKPKSHLLDINLREVWRYRDLLWMFIKRDFAAQYKQTLLGPLWHFIQPLFTTLIFVVVFSKIAAISTDGLPPLLFYLSGITIWNYFSSCLIATSNTFIANAYIFGKVYFPRLVMPISVVLSNMVKFGIQLLLLIAVMIGYAFNGVDIHVGMHLLYIPVLLMMMAGMGLGLGIIISSLTTKYRDFTVLVTFGVQLLMYATPVVYPISVVQNPDLKFWLSINPLTPLVEAFRYTLLGVGSFDTIQLLFSGVFILFVLVFGLLLFGKVERTFMDTV